MSGDLKEPRKALPLGTIAAILTGYAVYLALPIFLWAMAPRAVLRDNPMVMWELAWLPQLIYAGIWGATLSSAMGALLGGARTLQALANDRVVPRFLGHGSGPGNDPRLATLITFAIGMGGLYAGSLDALAPILSMFFLTSYGTLNLIAALEGLMGNPSWRPTFRIPWRLALVGSLLCVGTMLMIDPGAALTAIFACSLVYALMLKRRMRANWSDLRGGILQALARFAVYRVGRYQDVAKVWQPNILLFSGSPTSRWYLVALADAITHGKGFLTVATVIEGAFTSEDKVRKMEKSIQDYLAKNNVPALVRVKYAPDFVPGVEGLATDYGLGHIEPNTIMMGNTDNPEHIPGFCALLMNLHRQRKNVILVRDSNDAAREGLELRPEPEVDVWMSNQNNNATLMLIFAYLVQSSTEWRGATLNIKSLVANEDARRGQRESLEAFATESRIDATTECYVKHTERTPFEEIGRYSGEAGLVFIGMREPEEGETVAQYAEYYRGLLEATRAFPLTIMTLAGERIEFREVFR